KKGEPDGRSRGGGHGFCLGCLGASSGHGGRRRPPDAQKMQPGKAIAKLCIAAPLLAFPADPRSEWAWLFAAVMLTLSTKFVAFSELRLSNAANVARWFAAAALLSELAAAA